MINSLKQLQETLSKEDLARYYNESTGKTPEEIKELFKNNNIEISDEAAIECFEFCKNIVDITKDGLDEQVVGGRHNWDIPYHPQMKDRHNCSRFNVSDQCHIVRRGRIYHNCSECKAYNS